MISDNSLIVIGSVKSSVNGVRATAQCQMRTRVKIETVAGAIDEVDVVKSMVKSVKRPFRSCREVEFVSKRLPKGE